MVVAVDVEVLPPPEPLVQRRAEDHLDGVPVAVVVLVVHVLDRHARLLAQLLLDVLWTKWEKMFQCQASFTEPGFRFVLHRQPQWQSSRVVNSRLAGVCRSETGPVLSASLIPVGHIQYATVQREKEKASERERERE